MPAQQVRHREGREEVRLRLWWLWVWVWLVGLGCNGEKGFMVQIRKRNGKSATPFEILTHLATGLRKGNLGGFERRSNKLIR